MVINMDINNMTRKQFEELPLIEDEVYADSLVLIPTRRRHDSGFNLFDIVVCNKFKPIGRCGLYDTFSIMNMQEKYDRYGIDCLHKSGLMRVFVQPNKYKISPFSHILSNYKEK